MIDIPDIDVSDVLGVEVPFLHINVATGLALGIVGLIAYAIIRPKFQKVFG